MGKKSRSKWGPARVPSLRNETSEAYRIRGAMGQRMLFVAPGRTPSSVQEQARLTAATISQFADEVAACDLYWVTDAMAQMALEASHKMPLINPGERPTPRGFLCFEKPLPPVAIRDAGTFVDHQGQEISELAVDGLVWVQHGESVQISLTFRAERAESGINPMPAGVSWPRIPMDEILVLTIPAGGIPDLEAAGAHGIEPKYVPITAFVGAMWHLMSRDDVADTTVVTPAPIQGRGDSGSRSSGRASERVPVTLVDMKPLKHEHVAADQSGRVYTHRFVVSGHWRNQAHGKGRQERRTQWIAPYIKGPKGAPMASRERVNVWRHM